MYTAIVSLLLVAFLVFVFGNPHGGAPTVAAAMGTVGEVASQAPQLLSPFELTTPGDAANWAPMPPSVPSTVQPQMPSSALPATIAPWEDFDTIGTAQTERATALGQVAQASIEQSRMRPPIDTCNDETVPCEPEVVWNNIFPGCPSFHIPLEGKDYVDDPRIWQGDLNPLLLERMALQAKEWNPYEHMQARQAMIQLLTTNWSGKSDRYTRPIDDLDAVNTTCANAVETPVMY